MMETSTMGTNASDARFMARALQLAELGRNTTTPNPRVGCVIVDDGGAVVGEAWHERAGSPHAEVLALRQAGEAARDATVYVNLEPCCHQGRTPPCAGALVDAGVARVVAAMEDPNPQVVGGGIEYLRGAGVDVDVGLMREQAQHLNRGFAQRMRSGRPWVTVKVAASVDGRTAMASGESQWITSEAARADAHRLRAASCAIVTGIGTVSADDPQLTARGDEYCRQPLRVVVDSGLNIAPDARVLNGEGAAIIVTGCGDSARAAALEARGVEIVCLPGEGNTVDLEAMLDHLGRREVNEMLLEAGPTLSGTMLEQGFVDELLVYVAPDLLGAEARPMFHLPSVKDLSQRLALKLTDSRVIGPDLRLTFAINHG